MILLLRFVDLFTQILTLAIFARAIISWLPIARDNPLVQVVFQVTEPVLGPLRRIVPMVGMIDLTPLVAIFLLQMINSVVTQLL